MSTRTTTPRRGRGPGRKPSRRLAQYRLPPDLLARLADRAQRDGTTRTTVVENALRAALDGRKGP